MRGTRKLPNDTRLGSTLHFTIIARRETRIGESPAVAEVDGYVTANSYEDGQLSEVFVRVSKQHEALGPMMDEWAKAVSVALQHGTPIDVLLEKHVGTRFEPSGAVAGVDGITKCSSPLDLIVRWLLRKYGRMRNQGG